MPSVSKIEHTEQLERVARAICAARGHNPDELAEGSKDDFLNPQHNGLYGLHSAHSGPAWETFAQEAAVFIAASKAL
ncbi:MAG: hypothetical protein JWR59_2210 [Brevundimonas sp.]|nr:hypothetical protein [Brevundimonas sp.]